MPAANLWPRTWLHIPWQVEGARRWRLAWRPLELGHVDRVLRRDRQPEDVLLLVRVGAAAGILERLSYRDPITTNLRRQQAVVVVLIDRRPLARRPPGGARPLEHIREGPIFEDIGRVAPALPGGLHLLRAASLEEAEAPGARLQEGG
jgi:hypothetical protein